MIRFAKGAVVGASLSLAALALHAQTPDLGAIPAYKKEVDVVGGLRIAGSELKGNVGKLVEGFMKFHPGARMSTNFMTSSEAGASTSDARIRRVCGCPPIRSRRCRRAAAREQVLALVWATAREPLATFRTTPGRTWPSKPQAS